MSGGFLGAHLGALSLIILLANAQEVVDSGRQGVLLVQSEDVQHISRSRSHSPTTTTTTTTTTSNMSTPSSAPAGTPNESTCGENPSRVADCGKPDHGSCGNACCAVNVTIASPRDGASLNFTTHIYDTIKGYLNKGGKDGSYAYITGPDAAGHNPSDDLTEIDMPWDFVFQGTHTTAGGYVDTLNFAITRQSAATDSITLRVFSISNIHGALGDGGQNYKNIAYLLEGRTATVIHGCGGRSSLPTAGRSPS